MILDSSAIISILREETDCLLFIQALSATLRVPAISTATLLEINVVLARAKDDHLLEQLNHLIADFNVQAVAFTMEQQSLASIAYRTFGRGGGHPAKLNFGDCFAYALAKEQDLPLLFKGDDFRKTDIKSVL